MSEFIFISQTEMIWNFSLKQKLYQLQEERKKTQTYSIVPKSPPVLLLTRAHWDHTQILDLNCSCQVLLKYSLHHSKNHYLNELSLSLPYCLRAPRVIHILVWETRDLPSQLYANSILYLGKRNPFKQAFSSKKILFPQKRLIYIY